MTKTAIETIVVDAPRRILADRIVLTLSAVCTILTLAWVLRYSHYGLDITDESFYLVWMSNPFNYSVSATQFGFIYHPLYELLDGNIAKLRQANILLTFALSWWLGNVFFKTISIHQSLQTAHRLAISAAIATVGLSSLIFAGLWLPTPSYNGLVLQALLIAATGFLLADGQFSRTSAFGWLLIGVGGWLAFMAKPTTAMALAVCAVFYLKFSGKLNLRLLAISVVVAVVSIAVSAVVIDGSIVAFIDRLKGGAAMYSMLGGGHTPDRLLRLDDFRFGGRGSAILIACTAIISATAYLCQAKSTARMHVGTVLSLVFVSTTIVIICGFIRSTLDIGGFQGLLIWSVPFAAILTGLSISHFKGFLQISRSKWVLALTFLLLPYAFAFGTSANYWMSGAIAGIFWLLAGLGLLSSMLPHQKLSAVLLPLGLSAQMVTVALIQSGMESPYRQPQPLRQNNDKLEIGASGSILVLPKGFAQYFTDAISVAKHAGFERGTPVIDLTGQSPGVLYAMGASNIGQPWTVGGYPGSEALALSMLKIVGCQEFAKAWLLIEPKGPRKISPEFLLELGANIATDFQNVGTFKTAEGAGGYKEIRVQQLLKPVRPMEDATTACSTRTALKR